MIYRFQREGNRTGIGNSIRGRGLLPPFSDILLSEERVIPQGRITSEATGRWNFRPGYAVRLSPRAINAIDQGRSAVACFVIRWDIVWWAFLALGSTMMSAAPWLASVLDLQPARILFVCGLWGTLFTLDVLLVNNVGRSLFTTWLLWLCLHTVAVFWTAPIWIGQVWQFIVAFIVLTCAGGFLLALVTFTEALGSWADQRDRERRQEVY